MLTHTTYLFITLVLYTFFSTNTAYNPETSILLNCGASSSLNDSSSRTWESDGRSKYAPLQSSSSSEMLSSTSPPVRQVPYGTARVFKTQYSYIFPLLNGPKFVRLYFFPDTYSAYNTTQSFFSVTANNCTLLSNFSAYLNAPPPPKTPAFYKEFIVNVEETQILNLTFAPNSDSFAFINGIEIVSMPDTLYFRGEDVAIKSVTQLFYLKNSSALENLYRLNVGGADVQIQSDTGMFRYWSQDDEYIFGADFGYIPGFETETIKYTADTPNYTAPDIVYQTSRVMANTSISLEWSFPVDSGFYYLLRFHLCENQPEVTKQNQRVFNIAVDNQTLETQTDVIFLSGGKGIPIHRDYVVFVLGDGRRGKKEMRLSLYPNIEGNPKYADALLNGLEIFKISDSKQSLAASNPERLTTDADSPPVDQQGKNTGHRQSSFVYAIIGGVIGVVALIVALLGFFTVRRRNKGKEIHKAGTTKSSWVPIRTVSGSTTRTSRSSGAPLPSDLCRHFSLVEIKSATNDFDEGFLIGKGGFGNVYRGLIDDETKAVAIKRLNPSSSQGAHEFLTEIQMLSKMRHVHLVSLIGYCDENGEMILVYDYMSRGTLRDHLYRSDNPPLTWIERLRICIGAAKGLDYLHTGAKLTIIHRDVKSTNILLDDKFVAKVSDFGLSKVGPKGGDNTHVTTVVKGSFGYVDPEYYRRQQLTDKSDVYSFGVLLFEVLCGRPAIMNNLPKEQVNLAEWAKLCHRKGAIEDIIDPNLKGQIALECLSKFVETAILCLRDKGIERPTMSDVVWSLEFAMQLQESAQSRNGDKDSFMSSPSYPLLVQSEESKFTSEGDEIFTGSSENNVYRSKSSSSFLSSTSNENLKSRDIFSEIKNPSGR